TGFDSGPGPSVREARRPRRAGPVGKPRYASCGERARISAWAWRPERIRPHRTSEPLPVRRRPPSRLPPANPGPCGLWIGWRSLAGTRREGPGTGPGARMLQCRADPGRCGRGYGLGAWMEKVITLFPVAM